MTDCKLDEIALKVAKVANIASFFSITLLAPLPGN
jgi:hypothetical protein